MTGSRLLFPCATRWVARSLAGGLALTLLANRTPAVASQESSTPEVFEVVDPYTKAKNEAFDRAGYLSLGPFPFAGGIHTKDIEEALGGVRVLWVETAHFKLGSMLHTYRRGTDDIEEKKLADELRRLSKKLPRVRTEPRELDPWLRVHLFAERLEEEYADFQARAGVSDADFTGSQPADTSAAASMGPGRYLGSEMKFTVLLTEKSSQLERFARRWLGAGESTWYRSHLPGGSWFFGAAAQVTQKMGTPLDSALHALVASGVAHNLVSGFRGTGHARPLWLAQGLSLLYGRKAEPRWCVFVPRESAGPEDETWHWEERVSGLVTNKFVPTWDEMFAWKDTNALEPRHHLTAWSRVAWLMESETAGFQKFLRAVTTQPEAHALEPARPEAPPGAERRCLEVAFGKTTSELDQAWRKWVRRKYPKK